ncbi:hypothetical protein, partial [Nonomuraea jabiensis]|uniref:hypothetical protein n=1 Tax=Nonomuraea jabiensis TaxID=882448 RepID=UPI0036840A6A
QAISVNHDGDMHVNHALAFNTLLSSQETDAYILAQVSRPSLGGVPHVFLKFTELVDSRQIQGFAGNCSDLLRMAHPGCPGATLVTYRVIQSLSNQPIFR